MLTLEEYGLLNSCANGPELFSFLFAGVNRDGDAKVSGREVARVAAGLIRAGLLRCRYAPGAPGGRDEVPEPLEEDFAVYDGYGCVPFREHVERYGFGPREFEATQEGVREIERPVYEAYDRELGW